ncbi:uncharacterized protein LOC116931312 [Daphnia magna]|uniref:uncharacterized protein LOC116931312 n=1 Tax=Daphnia magna TaxID=35525 RepID=UPI001E1BB5F2|nr:uncharacterized protein LOC116931312 [Daphnia magna]
MMSTQNGILGSLRLIATMEQGANKIAAKDVLAEFRKAHELMRQRLFILTIWRKFDYATADKVARRKAGEYLDPDLAKVLEEKDKREIKRERKKEKDRSRGQGKRFRGNHSYQVDFGAGPSNPRGYHGHGANKPDLIQVPLSTKITQDNNVTEQSNINDDHTEFIPGSIHQEKVREFWIKELKAGDWVLNVLEEGYIIPFTKAPAAYEEPNNASANKDPVFVHQAVTELATLGIIQKTIAYGPKPILAKELAGTLGKMVSTEPALGPVVIMAARAAYIELDAAVQGRGWSTFLEEKIWASDASGFATCAYSIKGEKLYYRGLLNEDERRLSSGHRELLAVRKTLEYYQHTGATNNKATNIYWLTDSQNLTTFLTKGSGKRHIQRKSSKSWSSAKNLV